MKRKENKADSKASTPTKVIETSEPTISVEKNITDLYDKLNFKYGSCSIKYEADKNGKYRKHPNYTVKLNGETSTSWEKPIYNPEKKYNGLYILTGKKSDIIVLDLDDMNKEENKKLYGEAITNCNMIVKTRKGFHLYFKYSEEFPSTIHCKKCEFDLLSTGSHIYAAPTYYVDENNMKIEYTIMAKPENELSFMSKNLIDLINGYLSQDIPVIKKMEKKVKKELDKVEKEGIKVQNTTIEEVKIILENLSIERADEYYPWIFTGYAIKNGGYSVELWDEFSKRSKKYEVGKCRYLFNNMKAMENGGITVATLWLWLKKDNVEVFDRLQKDRLLKDYDSSIDKEICGEFDTIAMSKIFKNDVRKFGKNYLSVMEETKGFKYFSHYHCFVEDKVVYFRKKFKGSRYDLERTMDLCSVYECLTVDGTNFTRLWKKSDFMPRHSRIEFIPYLDVMNDPNNDNKRILNMFTGYKYYKKDHVVNFDNVKFFLDHILYLCSGDKTVFEYLTNWVANIIQRPSKKSEVAIVLYSFAEGVGKNSFTDLLVKLFDGYTAKVMNIDMVASKFNSDMAGKLIVAGDEIKARAQNMADELKNAITQKEIRIEYKGVDSIILKDYSNYIFTTNNELILKISRTDRRYCLIECPDELKPLEYFNDYFGRLENDDMMVDVFMYFATLDISKFNTRIIPMTEYKKRNVINSLPSYIQMMRDRYIDFDGKSISGQELYKYSISYAKENRLSTAYTNMKFFKDFKIYFGDYYVRGDNINKYLFPENMLDEEIEKCIDKVITKGPRK